MKQREADELIKRIEEYSTGYPGELELVNMDYVKEGINAMVEPGSPKMVTCPNPNCRNGVLRRKGFLRSVCPDCNGTGNVPKDSQ